MASFDLVAKLALDDKLSAPLKRIERQIQRTNNILNRINNTTDASAKANENMSRTISQVDRVTKNLTGSQDRLKDSYGRNARTINTANSALNRANRTSEGAVKASDKVAKSIFNADEATGYFADSQGRLRDSYGRFASSANTANDALSKVNRTSEHATKVNAGMSKSLSNADRSARGFIDSQGRLRESFGRYTKSAGRAGGATGGFNGNIIGLTRSVKGAVGGIFSLQNALIGLGTVYAGVRIGKGIFDSTIGQAMNYEINAATIDAMFDSEVKGKQFRDMVERIAIESPVLESGEMMNSAKGFISQTDDLEDLEKMIRLVEKLVSYDPIQGTEGASFALRELMSGDARSIKERFEMNDEQIDTIKDLFKDGKLTDGVDAFEKYLSEDKRITDKVIEKMGNTAAGKWAQVRERWQVMLRGEGSKSLQIMADWADDVLSFLESDTAVKMLSVGGEWIKNILKGLADGSVKLFNWFKKLGDSPEWKNASLIQKVNFVIEDLGKKFNKWYDSGGKEDLRKLANTLVDNFAQFIEESTPTIIGAGLKFGSAFIDGIKQYFDDNPVWGIVTKTIGGAAAGGKIAGPAGAVMGGAASGISSGIDAAINPISPYIFGQWDKNKSEGGTYKAPWDYWKGNGHDPKDVVKYSFMDDWNNYFGSSDKSAKKSSDIKPRSNNVIDNAVDYNKNFNTHNGGLDYVPYDSYRSLLHKGEKVLTRGEAREYRENKKSGGSTTATVSVANINLYGVGGDLEGAADELMGIITKKIEMAGAAGA